MKPQSDVSRFSSCALKVETVNGVSVTDVAEKPCDVDPHTNVPGS